MTALAQVARQHPSRPQVSGPGEDEQEAEDAGARERDQRPHDPHRAGGGPSSRSCAVVHEAILRLAERGAPASGGHRDPLVPVRAQKADSFWLK
ncbi:hypothetical protein GCM10009867_04320 [Pedococcus aerophilus]|uniref:Uncharacterized protein n=1 Tax=Pedococcus aerophilus TaxID=436356 RepID=A0ABP6GUZ4_9MICO